MIRRGIVIPEYEEVMTAPEEKTEEAPVDIMGDGSNTLTPASPDGTTTPENPSAETPRPIDKPDTTVNPTPDKEPPVEQVPHNDDQPKKEDE
jgi:hypothetical protein